MPMLSYDPFETLLDLQRTLDTFRQSRWLESSPSAGGSYPPINVFRKGDDLLIIAEVPGVNKSNLDIQIQGNAVRIAGSKTIDYPNKASLHRRERLTGAFDRTVALPVEIDPDRVRAECRDGLLALFLARAERDKPKSIKIS
ncbi:MAG TPA: Hsp20/alpha crystallin family protein [Stellaceae bacterium]|nr:Hsp20/alpha crystallin family protein [Stellaceae bacterium]